MTGSVRSSTDVATESMIPATEVQLGDVLRSRDGTEFTVSRIEPFGMFDPSLLALVEDSDVKWFKMPSMPDGEVTLLHRA